MKILIVGAGAIGGYYGARLIQAGADVTFLVRSKRAAFLASHGLLVNSELGGFSESVNTVLREELQAEYDLIVLTCKTFDLPDAMDCICVAVGPETGILPLLNGLSVYDQLDARFGSDRVLGGIAYIATICDDAGVIHHLGNNDIMVVGERSESTRKLAKTFHSLITKTPGVRVHSTNITQALWNKWIMLATAALMNCLMRGTIADILSTQDGYTLMKQALAESLIVAAAENNPLSAAEVQHIEGRLLDPKSTWAASMMRDLAQGAPGSVALA